MRFKIYILSIASLLFLSGNSFAKKKLKEFETTRVMQSAGAGVGALLINEVTVLNPAAITFIKDSTLYYQRSKTNLNDKNTSRNTYKEGQNEFLGFSDTTTPLKGGFSYLYQNEQEGNRKRFSLSSSGNVTKTTSLGMVYKYTDEFSDIIDNTYHQFTFGLTHIYDENIYLGLVVVDPQNKISEYSHYTLGIQYVMNNFIHILLDVGSGDTANSDKKAFTRYALQINSFQYFYFRTGRFHDKFNNIKGYTYGVSWVGPKFSIDYAYKNAEFISDDSEELYDGEHLIETSIALSALF